ncbi:MAG: efflux transporter outer membrane subunit [Bryobacterales bacterium]|nr:efflux transporter outer membrane subunit [Bryobacterales bacterium]MBV9396935.1 efflux transporter outer membrane subunit [Bryobacterales bacterium]
MNKSLAKTQRPQRKPSAVFLCALCVFARKFLLPSFLLVALAGCRVGPNYMPPSAPAPPAFKEQPPQGWKESQPSDGALKGNWWEIYKDPELNALEEHVAISNQNVLQAEAAYQQARAAVQVSRAALFPTAGATPGITASANGGTSSGNSSLPITSTGTGAFIGGTNGVRTTFNLPFSASWAPDFWGNIRRGVTAAVANAQSAAAEIENAKLLYQAELAQNYFGIRGIDVQTSLLTRTQLSYREYLQLTENRFAGGIASELDIAQAETQLFGVESQLIELGVQRAAYEHAIAILIGKPPAEVTIPTEGVLAPPPEVPVGVPSALLERRPDIASSERRVAAANEQIGIAMAAFYPTITLSGSVGLANSNLLSLFTWPSRFWSVGSSLAETLFDAGRRRAVVGEQRAAYDETVGAYRQTVLTAFQQVEDNLSALRILQEESAKVQETVRAAQRTLELSTAEYRAGTANYLTVITSQAALLNAQVTASNVLTRRLTASVGLIQALGGGWNSNQLPTRQAVAAR